MNSLYILSHDSIEIDKFHICTWDMRNVNSMLEIGMAIDEEQITNRNELQIYIYVPFANGQISVKSLHQELSNVNNFRFIFNEEPTNVAPFHGDPRNGSSVTYGNGNNTQTYFISNVELEILNNSIIKVHINKPNVAFDKLYFRLLINPQKNTIAYIKKGISQKSYIYDIKINEARNVPDEIFDFIRNHNLQIDKIRKSYCLHCVPDDCQLVSFNSAKLKNVRQLEMDAFRNYLTILKNVKGKYIITFAKDDNTEGNTFFTTFSREYIGNKQLSIGILLNLLCSLLFGISSFRQTLNPNEVWYHQIPIEFVIAIIVIIIGVLFCFPINIRKSWKIK